jgi:hypothetical protein
MKQPYVIIKQESRFSKITGAPMTKITFLGIKDRQEYVTYIDSPNRNHDNWQHITNNPEHGFVVRSLRTKKAKGKTLIDADSKPVIEWEDDDDTEIMRQLSEVWAEEDRKNDSDKFRDFFE